MKTDSTSWSQLTAQIDQYRKRAKQNLQKYERKKFDSLYKKKRQKTDQMQEYHLVPQKLGYSLNLIREKQYNQKIKTSVILNKVSFLKVQRDRKIQSTEIARNKLERVLSIRSTSSQEKQFCESQIKSFRQRNYQRKRDLTNRVKSERAKIQQQRKRILSSNSYRAKETREQRALNEEIIQQQKQADVAKRQKMVEKGQQQYEESIQKKKEKQQAVIEKGKAQHSNYKKQEYIKYQSVKKMNQQMFAYFKRESEKIVQETEQAHRNLMNFQTLLMMRRRSKTSLEQSSKGKDNASTPFTQTTNSSSRVKRGEGKNINKFFHLTN